MLQVTPEFSNDTQSKDINVIPLVKIVKGDFTLRLSTNNISLPDVDDGSSFHYKPLIASIPGIKESVDFENRRYKISSLSISASNFKYDNERLSDITTNLINADVTIYWKSQSCDTLGKCLTVFKGKVRRVNHSSDKFTFHVEDISQENLHKDLPISVLGDKGEVPERYRNKAIPMVYGDVDKSPAVISYSKSTTEETGVDVFDEIVVKLDSDTSIEMESNSLYLFDDKYLGVPGVIPTLVGGGSAGGFTAPYIDNLQYEISNNKLIFKSFPSSDDDANAFAINEGNLIAYEVLSPSSVASYIPFREGYHEPGIYIKYFFTNSLVKTPDWNADGLPPFTENIRIAGTLLKEQNEGSWGGESKTLNWGKTYNEDAGEWNDGIGGDDVDQEPSPNTPIESSLVGCIVKLNPSPIDTMDDEEGVIGELFFRLRMYNYDLVSYAGGFPTVQIRVGGNTENDFLDLSNFTCTSDGSEQIPDIVTPEEGHSLSGIINNHKELSIYADLQTARGIVGLEIEFIELYLKRWLLVKNILNRDYYAKVEGRHDLTGDYTGFAWIGGGRTGSREDWWVVNPIDEETVAENEIETTSSFQISTGQPSGESTDYLSLNPTEDNALVLIKFRDYEFNWTDFIEIIFMGRHFQSEGTISVYLGQYGEEDNQIHLDNNIIIGNSYYYLAPDAEVNWTSGWQSHDFPEAAFLQSGTPPDMINCMIIKLGLNYIMSRFYIDDIVVGALNFTIVDPVIEISGCTDDGSLNYGMGMIEDVDSEYQDYSEVYPPGLDESDETYNWTDDGSCNYVPGIILDVRYTPNYGDNVIDYPFYNWNEMEAINLEAPITWVQANNALFIDTLGSGDPSEQTYTWSHEIVSGTEFNISEVTLIDSDDMTNNPRVGFFIEIPELSSIPEDETVSFQVNITATDSQGDSTTIPISWEVYGTLSPGEPEPPPPTTYPIDTDGLITNPADVIHHIIKGETGADIPSNGLDMINARMDHVFKDFYNVDEPSDYSWKFAFSQNKKINSKKLIEEIAKNTKLFPKFGNDGEFGFSSIRDVYNIDAAYVLEFKESDVINFSLSRTKVEQVYSRVKVLYKKDYADDEYKKDTGWMFVDDLEQIDKTSFFENNGIEEEEVVEGELIGGQELIFKSDYIRHDNTAKALRHFLLGWNVNQHNILKVKLPLQYLKYEIGDTIAFDKILGDTLAYGESYTRQAVSDTGLFVGRNGQLIYPLWMITGTNKNVDSVEIECIQLHDWTASMSRNYLEPGDPVLASMIIDNQNVFGADNNIGTSITEFLLHNTTGATVTASTWSFAEVDVDGNIIEELPDYTIIEGNRNVTVVFDIEITTPKTIRVTLSTSTQELGEIFTYSNLTLYRRGDINADGEINVLDVVMSVNGILTESTLDDNQRYRADYSGDGAVNVLDVVMSVNDILGN